MKTKRKPLEYVTYDGKPCYLVEFFAEELEMLSCALHEFSDSKLYGVLRDDFWDETERRFFAQARFQLEDALCQVENHNVVLKDHDVIFDELGFHLSEDYKGGEE